MENLIALLCLFIGLQHVGFLVLEMFFWTKPLGQKVFKTQKSFAEQSASLAANQGLYNGFLASGLFWSLVQSDPIMAHQLKFFFLVCVLIAGLYGALTVSKNILFIQALPACLTLILLVTL